MSRICKVLRRESFTQAQNESYYLREFHSETIINIIANANAIAKNQDGTPPNAIKSPLVYSVACKKAFNIEKIQQIY